MHDQWLSIAYQYIIGGLFFLVVIGVALKSRVINFQSSEGKNTFWVLIVGFVFFLITHSVWVYLVTP